MDLADARRYVTAVEAAAPYDLRVRPWRAELAPDFARLPGQLPLWLEPDIDYQQRLIRFDPVEYDEQAPHRSVLLHEVTHLAQTDVLYPNSQTSWLTEAVCDYFAASWTGSPVLWLLSPRYPALSRTLEHQLRYPEDLDTQRQWVLRLVDAMLATDLRTRHPDTMQQVQEAADGASDNEPAPHSFGQIIGGAFWEASQSVGRETVWKSLLGALRNHPRPAGPSLWMESWVEAVGRYGGGAAREAIARVAARRGL